MEGAVKYYRIVDGPQQPILQTLYEVKRTARGAWICWPWAYGIGQFDRRTMHWVSDTARRRFAYPTVELALDSYKQRKRWQIQHARNSIEKAEAMLLRCELADVWDETLSFCAAPVPVWPL